MLLGKSETEESSDGVSAAAMDAIADEDFDRLWDEAVVEAAAKSHDVSSEQTGEGSVNEEKSEPEATRFELREEMYIELIDSLEIGDACNDKYDRSRTADRWHLRSIERGGIFGTSSNNAPYVERYSMSQKSKIQRAHHDVHSASPPRAGAASNIDIYTWR
mmetsp:Transcript_9797/g.14889  ORF Transcript_9797/g.14889 Transcript_9797/m.14889 type:complete len:161 (-) Transcript_9797:408-890(-)